MMGSPDKAAVLAARKAAGLTQEEAAALIYRTKRNWQQWEGGERAMDAALFELFQAKAGRVVRPSEALARHRAAIRAVVLARHATNPRVFGSAATGTDTEASDLDILVDPTAETTLLDIGAMRHELRELTGVKVDVLTPMALPERWRARVIAQAVPI